MVGGKSVGVEIGGSVIDIDGMSVTDTDEIMLVMVLSAPPTTLVAVSMRLVIVGTMTLVAEPISLVTDSMTLPRPLVTGSTTALVTGPMTALVTGSIILLRPLVTGSMTALVTGSMTALVTGSMILLRSLVTGPTTALVRGSTTAEVRILPAPSTILVRSPMIPLSLLVVEGAGVIVESGAVVESEVGVGVVESEEEGVIETGSRRLVVGETDDELGPSPPKIGDVTPCKALSKAPPILPKGPLVVEVEGAGVVVLDSVEDEGDEDDESEVEVLDEESEEDGLGELSVVVDGLSVGLSGF